MASKRYTSDHKWAVATYVPLPERLVIHGIRRGTVRVPVETKVDVLEVHCLQCRRDFTDVYDKPCEAAQNRDHLIGGPTGERRKRDDEDDDDALAL